MSNNLESQSKSIFDKNVSRRGFLKGAALGAAGLAALRYLPAAAQSDSEVATATSEQEPLNSWDNLPIVDGEPNLVGELDLRNVYAITKGVNFRTENSTRGNNTTVIENLPVGAILEGLPDRENLPDLDPASTLLWNEMNLVYNGTVLEETKNGYVAQGYFAPATEVPAELAERYATSTEISDSNTELVASSFTSVFDKFGGTEDFSNAVAAAWGVKLTAGETFSETTTESSLRAWQLAVSIAAAGIKGDDVSEIVDVGELAGESSAIKLYRKVNGNSIDVIGRAVNPQAEKHTDLFVISRFENDEKKGQIVKSVGFTTPEGFAAAYPELAQLAPEFTAMTGDGVDDLMAEIVDIDQAKVFLAELNAFAPKANTEKGSTAEYRREGSSRYSSVVTDVEGQEIRHSTYFKKGKKGMWVDTWNAKDGEKELPLWALAGSNGPQIGAQVLHYELSEFGPNTYSKTFVRDFDTMVVDGELELANEYVGILKQEPENLKEVLTKIQTGEVDLITTDPKDLIGFDFKALNKLFKFAEQNGINTELHHAVTDAPQWLIDGYRSGKYSATDVGTFLKLVSSAIAHKGKGIASVYSVATDTAAQRLWGDHGTPTRFWEEVLGPTFIDTAAEAIQSIDPEAALLINEDYIHDQQEGAQVQLSQEIYNTADRLLRKGIHINIGMQMTLDTAKQTSAANISRQMRWFADGLSNVATSQGLPPVRVFVTEARVKGNGSYAQKAPHFAAALQACKDVGPDVCASFSTFGFTDASDVWIPGMPFDDKYQSTEVYDAMANVLKS